MVWLKSCRRCGGDLYMETDQFGAYVSCFQCGAAVANGDENATDDNISETVDAVVAQAQSA